MSFLNPWVLSGLAAVSVPIAIHLLNKFRVQKTRWAAMRFVQDSLQRNRRRLQIEDLLLLILRCLVVVALVLAFARPVWKTLVPGVLTGGDGAAVTAVVLDNSASMGQSNGVASRFDEGKAAIRAWLESRPAGAPLAFFLVSDRAEALMAKPVADVPRFRRSLELAALSDRPTNLAQGIRTAAEALKPFAGEGGEILVFTDSQTLAWRGMEEIQKVREANPGLTITPMTLGQAGEANLAIVGLQAEGGVPAAGQPCRFRVDVTNFGTEPAEGVRLTIAADDRPPSDESLLPRIEPGATQSANLFVRFDTAGFHAVTASIPPDRLPVDNQRALALQVVDRLGILIVEGEGGGAASERDGYFLGNALAPVSPDQAKSYYLTINTVPFASLGQTSFSSYDTVFLCNPGTPSGPLVAALKAYVQAGGNLVIFPGAKTDGTAWSKISELATLLPAEMGARKKGVKPALSLASEGFTHPVTAIWNDRAEGGLGAVKYTDYFPLKVRDSGTDKGTVILALANGEPAAVEGTLGAGRVVLFNGPAIPDGSNLVLHPGFVALIQRLMGHLNRGSATRLILAPGESFELPVAMELLGRDFSVIRPGTDGDRRPAGRVEVLDDRAVMRFRDTEMVGAYQIFLGQDTQASAVFAVQMDPAESDLRQAGTEELARLTERGTLGTVPDATPALREQVTAEFWTLFIWLAAGLALAEAALAHVMSRSR